MKARTLIVTALVPLTLAASVARANMPSHRDASIASRAAHANANALVRIDPETNAISRVIGVGSGPIAVAVGRRSIWVYSDSNRKATEIDAATNMVRRSTTVAPRPVELGQLAGPMLAVDPGGAWLVGIDPQQGPLLTRVPAGTGDTRTYALNVEPRAVAVGDGAVWVLGHRPGDNELIRLNKATGEVTGRTWLPDSGRVDSVAVGRGYAWVMYSSTATLYRVNARTMELGPHADLGQRAGRPRISGGMVWVGVSNAGGRTLLLDGSTLNVVLVLSCCGLRDGHDTVDAFGSNWTTDQQTGTTVRSDGRNYERFTKIHVTKPPRSGGLCETAIVAGAGAVWVAVGPTLRHRCGSQLQARTPPYGGVGATVASFNAANQNRPGKPSAGATYDRVGGTQSRLQSCPSAAKLRRESLSGRRGADTAGDQVSYAVWER